MASFKVPCPSCEAKVPIKNPDLIGKKVECPKCKYRFKVEPPADEAAAAAKADQKADAAAEDVGKKKKKPAKNNKVLIGAVLGVLAVGLLAVGGYVVFGGDGKKPSIGSVGPGSGPGGPGNNTEENGTEKKDGETPAPTKPGLPRSDKDPTNLLPGQSVAVYRFDLDRIRQTPVGAVLFDDAMAGLFKSSMGFDQNLVERYIHCVVGEKERAPFGVIRLKEPVDTKQVTARMGLGPAKKLNNREVHPVKANPFLTAVANTFVARSLLADVYDTVPGAPADGGKEKPLGACVYDTQTILVGDLAVVERFVRELNENGYPEYRTSLIEAPPPPPPMPPMNPGEGGMPMAAQPMPGAPGPAAPMAGGPMPAQPMPGGPAAAQPMPGAPAAGGPMPPAAKPAAGNKDFTSNPRYRTVDPELKRILNALEEDENNPPAVLAAEKYDRAAYDPSKFKKAHEPIAAVIRPVLDKTKYLGLNVTAFTPKQLVLTIRIVGQTDEAARTIALEDLTPSLNTAVPLLGWMMNMNAYSIQFRNYADPNMPFDPNNPAAGFPGAVGPGGEFPGFGPGFPGPGMPGPGMPGPGRGMPGPGMPGPGMPGPGRGMPGPGFPGPGGGQPPMGEGPGPGMPGPGGMFDPNMPVQPAMSHVDLRLVDNVVTLTVDLSWTDDTYGKFAVPRVFGVVNQVKGKMAVFAGDYSLHALGSAVAKLASSGRPFPQGAQPRPMTDQSRMGLPFPPAQRVSFFVELLPYMNRDGLARGIDRTRAWHDERNVAAAEAWVPELLVSYYPQTAWRAASPAAPDRVFGGTNFVAVAGVGVDAARYNPANAEHKARMGMTGYDWGSKPDEVTDGLANTIYLIQVPPGVSRPWIAGGGATVTGLDPQDPMANLKHTRADGEVGTHAIMGDGTVRWIPADINPKDLLALATRAGGEKLSGDLDTIAPKVRRPGQPEEAKLESKPAETAPMPKADTPPKKEEPKADTPAAPAPTEKKEPGKQD